MDKVLVSVLDVHAPVCESKITVRHKPKRYNADVQQAKRAQRRQERKLRKALKSNPDCDRTPYLEAKLHMAKTLLEARVSYYKSVFTNSSPKEIFGTLNGLLNKDQRFLPDVGSSQQLARAFTMFFSDKIKRIRNCIDDLNSNMNLNLSTEQSGMSSLM